MRGAVRAALWIAVLAGCGGPPTPTPPPARLPALDVTIEEVQFDRVEPEETRAVVAESVRVRASSEHIEIPPAVVDNAPDPDAWPRITTINQTAHGLVVWLSGPCARTIALPPHSQNAVEICAGVYQLAAQVAGGRYLPLVSERDTFENGYGYTFTFFVQSSPYGRRRQRRPRRRRRPR